MWQTHHVFRLRKQKRANAKESSKRFSSVLLYRQDSSSAAYSVRSLCILVTQEIGKFQPLFLCVPRIFNEALCATSTAFKSPQPPRALVAHSNRLWEISWPCFQSKSSCFWTEDGTSPFCKFLSHCSPTIVIWLTGPSPPSSYFHRIESQKGCAQCQDRVVPEEVKSALGVCTVFLLKKTVEWATSKEWCSFDSPVHFNHVL